MKINTIIETSAASEIPVQFYASIGFWNKNGHEAYEKNKSGDMGSKATQEAARNMTESEFLLDMILCDAKILMGESDTLIFGKSGSHIWVSLKKDNRRVLMITINGYFPYNK